MSPSLLSTCNAYSTYETSLSLSRRYILSLLSLMGCLTLNAQTLVNREWVAQYGLPDTVAWSASTADGSGHLYTTGNTFVPGNGADVLLTRYDPEGNLLWQQTYDHQGQNDYGVAILHHANGELTVAAALHDATDSFDVGLLRYDGSGNLLWSYSYDYQGQYDVPTALAEDANGNLYVCAASLGSSTDLDYLTLKVKEDGTFEWMQSYDFAAGRDVPVSLVVDGSDITVTGASEDSTGQWDFYTVMYDDNGNVIEEYRLDKPGIGFDEPAGIARDAAGNFYLTGRASDNGSTYYIQTVKLDAQLNLLWEVAYTHSGQDGATGLGLDSQGNVYVCGYLAEPTGQELILLKYDANGNLAWDKVETAENGGPAAATHLHINQEDQVLLTGYQAVNSQQRLYVAAFSSDGEKLWARSVEDGDYAGGEILTQGADAYVSARGFSNGTYQYVAVKYSFYEREANWVLDSEGKPLYAANELIVRFESDSVNAAAVDNEIGTRETQFGDLAYYLTPAAAQIIEDKLASLCGTATFSEALSGCPVKVLRIFQQLRTDDTTTLSRLGETIPIPKFWATFVLAFPAGIDVPAATDSLQSLFPLVKYAHPNVAITLTSAPNDPFYGEQASLAPTAMYPDADINLEPAWDIETGKSFVKVGVFDSGLDWRHPDFGYDGVNPNTSKMVDGWDFVSNSPLTTLTDPDSVGHGTKVAGILGAARNNQLGIVGVAGGNYTDSTDLANQGVSLYGLRIFKSEPDYFLAPTLSYIVDGIVTAAMDDSTLAYGYGVHISNHSWGFNETFPTYSFLSGVNITLMTDAAHFSNRAKVTFVASRGNAGESAENHYPAILDDDWVLCVGGTGDNGQYIDGFNGEFSASTGPQIDVAAPATNLLIRTTRSGGGYGPFNGTSAAAPYVAGVAALLMSYLNDSLPAYNNLAPEDVEQILQMTAFDPDTPSNSLGIVGYDTLTGHGRLDAGAALQLVEKSYRRLLHFGTDAFTHTQSVTLHASNQAITLLERYENAAGAWFAPDDYLVDVYEVTATVSHNLTATDSIVAAWPRASSTTVLQLYDGNEKLKAYERATLQSVNLSQAVLTGYVYKVYDLSGTFMDWWPFDTTQLAQAELTYSLLIQDKMAPTSVAGVAVSTPFSLHPNPGQAEQHIRFDAQSVQPISITLFDLQGRELHTVYQGQSHIGTNTIGTSLSGLPSGLYCYHIQLGSHTYLLKTLKQ